MEQHLESIGVVKSSQLQIHQNIQLIRIKVCWLKPCEKKLGADAGKKPQVNESTTTASISLVIFIDTVKALKTDALLD